MVIYEILVPTEVTRLGSKGWKTKPVRTKHHREWDKYVRKITGGLTILTPAKGQWIDVTDGKLYKERMIPVRIACTEEQIKKIAEFTKQHYVQIKVMYYRISEEVVIC